LRSPIVAGIAAMVLAVALTGCDYGVSLVGPSVAVRNDSGRAIVMRLGTRKWPVGLGEIRSLQPRLPVSAASATLTYEILDAASCQIIETVSVDFKSMPSAAIVVPATGPATVVSAEDGLAGRVDAADATESPNLCPDLPTDGSPGSTAAP
jgi:hypothetical protein